MIFNTEAEGSIIAAILGDSQNNMSSLIDELQPQLFYNRKYRAIFEAACDLFLNSKEINHIVIIEKLKGTDTELSYEEAAKLIESSVIASVNLKSNIALVKDAWKRRKLAGLQSTLAKANNFNNDIDALCDEIDKELFTIRDSQDTNSFLTISQLMSEKVTYLGDVYKHGKDNTLKTGLVDLDRAVYGFERGELVIIAGRPSTGKSSLGLQIAIHSAKQGKPGIFFSLEDSKDSLATRMLSHKTGIPYWRIEYGKFGSSPLEIEDCQRLIYKAGSELSNYNFMVDATSGLSVGNIMARCKRVKHQHGLNWIIIDYLGLINTATSKYKGNRNMEVGEITYALKGLAKELDIPVILLSQLSRNPEHRSDRKPILADLRESGNIEQDANIVILLHNNSKEKSGGKSELEDEHEEYTGGYPHVSCIVAKNKNNPTTEVNLLFDGNSFKFLNYKEA